jgi:hypothetical protein
MHKNGKLLGLSYHWSPDPNHGVRTKVIQTAPKASTKPDAEGGFRSHHHTHLLAPDRVRSIPPDRRPSLDDSAFLSSSPRFSSRLLLSGYDPIPSPGASAYKPLLPTGVSLPSRPSALDPSHFHGTLPFGPKDSGVNSWAEPEPSLFPVRSKSYLTDKRKVGCSLPNQF